MAAGRLRPATAGDIPRIIDMVEQLAEAVDGPQRVDRIRTGETLARLMASRDGLVLVSGQGFIAGSITQTLISPDRVAIEHGWYAEDRSGIALLRSFEDWARDKGAVLSVMSCKGGTAGMVLDRHGYRVSEIHMAKEL